MSAGRDRRGPSGHDGPELGQEIVEERVGGAREAGVEDAHELDLERVAHRAPSGWEAAVTKAASIETTTASG